MPLPKPKKDETKENFISRFMSNDTMKREFPDVKQRVAVAFSVWRNYKKSSKGNRGNKG